jgi:serine/threonine protein kinase
MLLKVRLLLLKVKNVISNMGAIAHWVAYNRAKILHRDISVGNILISADGERGLLIDWELCKRVSTIPPEPDPPTPQDPEVFMKPPVKRQPDRTVSRFFGPSSDFNPLMNPPRAHGNSLPYICS